MRERQKFDSIQSDVRDVRDNDESAKELTNASNKETCSLIKGVIKDLSEIAKIMEVLDKLIRMK